MVDGIVHWAIAPKNRIRLNFRCYHTSIVGFTLQGEAKKAPRATITCLWCVQYERLGR